MAILTGGTRNETLIGGAGSDTITGGAGNDTITGDNLIANGNFDGAGISTGYTSTVPPGWTILDSSIRNSIYGDGTQVGSFGDGPVGYIDTGNIANTYNGIQQSTGVNYDATASYNLQIDVGSQMLNSSPVTAEFLVNGVVVGTQTYQYPSASSGTFTLNAINLTVPVGATALAGVVSVRVYVHATSSNYAQTLVDNIELTTTSATIIGTGDSLSGGDGNDQLYGGTGNDTLNGDLNLDTLYGGIGNDSLYGGANSDQLYGETGDDLASGGDGADTVDGGIGNDTLNGDLGYDNLFGGSGNDTLYGGGNDDSLYGGDNDDLLYGGIANDNLLGDAGNDNLQGDAGNDSLYGGADNDSLVGGDNDDLLFGGIGNDTLLGDAGNDNLYGDGGNDTLSGGDGHDTLRGDVGNDGLDGGIGNDVGYGDIGDDTIHGMAGDDLLYGGDDHDQIYGWADNDTLLGGNGNDMVDGDEGNDSLDGELGDDTIIGDAGNDALNGGDGNDALYGGTGNDILTGGAGADFVSASDDADTIFGGAGDTVDGGEGGADNDTLDLTSYGFAATNIIRDAMNLENGTVEFLDGSGNVISTMAFTNIETIIACFTAGSKIVTNFGEVMIEDLQPGDLVLTRDNGFQPVRWVGGRDLTKAEIEGEPAFAPIEFEPGSLGPNMPDCSLMVSPQHRMLLSGADVEFYFAEHEVLVAAKHLVRMPGVTQRTDVAVRYIHILFDQHEIVCVQGAWSESFQPSVRSLDAFDHGQREEIIALFPALEIEGTFQSARTTLKAKEAEVLNSCMVA